METVIFIHLDTRGSGDYAWLPEAQGRALSTQLAKWAADKMRVAGAIHAAPRGGDAVNAVCRDFETALKVSQAISRDWRAQVEECKRKQEIGWIRMDWPGFRIVMAADSGDLTTDSILDENHHVWEAITGIKGFPSNAIVCRDNVVPVPDMLKQLKFHVILKPVQVRKGSREESWRVFLQLEPTRLGSYEFHGELLSSTMVEVAPTQVTITGNLDYAAVTKSALEIIRTNWPSWQPGSKVFPGPVPQSILDAFEEKQRERERDKELGVTRERGGEAPLLRLIADPHVDQYAVDLQVAPLSWELYSSWVPYPKVPIERARGRYVATDRHVSNIEKFMGTLPEVHPRSQTNWPLIGPRNFVPIGIEVLIMSHDRFALLRRKDVTTTASPGLWDVSFSGYARFKSDFGLKGSGSSNVFEIDISRWVSQELEREVGIKTVNLEGLRVFGVHRNRETEALDILGFLPVDIPKKEIARNLYIHRAESRLTSQYHAGAFSKTELAGRLRKLHDEFKRTCELPRSDGVAEREVLGTRNCFVPFNPEGIGLFLLERRRETAERNEYPRWGVMPEALATLMCSIAYVHGVHACDDVRQWVESEDLGSEDLGSDLNIDI